MIYLVFIIKYFEHSEPSLGVICFYATNNEENHTPAKYLYLSITWSFILSLSFIRYFTFSFFSSYFSLLFTAYTQKCVNKLNSYFLLCCLLLTMKNWKSNKLSFGIYFCTMEYEVIILVKAITAGFWANIQWVGQVILNPVLLCRTHN